MNKNVPNFPIYLKLFRHHDIGQYGKFPHFCYKSANTLWKPMKITLHLENETQYLWWKQVWKSNRSSENDVMSSIIESLRLLKVKMSLQIEAANMGHYQQRRQNAATGGAHIGYSLFMVGHAKIKSIHMPHFRWGTLNLGGAQAPLIRHPWPLYKTEIC